MKHIRKLISMLLVICMIGVTLYSNIGQLGTDGTVSAADEAETTTSLKRMSFDDFGIADGEYSATPTNHTAKHCSTNTAFTNTLFCGNFLFPTPESGARTKSTRVVFGSANGWEGLFFSVNPDGTIMHFNIGSVVSNEATDDEGFQIRTDQGTHNNWIGSFIDKEFKLEMSLEQFNYDNGATADDAKLKVYINGKQCELYKASDAKFYNEWVIQGAYTRGNLTNNIYFQFVDENNTVKVSSCEREKPLRELSFRDIGYEDGVYQNGITNSYGYSLKNTIISSKVTVDTGAYILYGAKGWVSFWVNKDKDGRFRMHNNGGTALPSVGDTADFYAYEPEGVDFESQFTFSITTEAFDCDGDGVADDAKVGFWADGNLLGNRYIGFQDVFADGKTINGFLMSGVTFESEKPDFPDRLRKLTLSDFGLAADTYISSTIKDPFGAKKPVSLLNTILSLDVEVTGTESWIQYASDRSYYWDGLCLQFSESGDLYVKFWKQSDGTAWHSDVTITAEQAGVTAFRNHKFRLDISLEPCDLNGDDQYNDVRLGLWFEKKLLNEQYYYFQDKASSIPTGMGLFTSRWSNGEASIKISDSLQTYESFDMLTLDGFGIEAGEYGYGQENNSHHPGMAASNTISTLDGKIFSTNVRFNTYDSDIYYGRRDGNNWDALRIGNCTDTELKGNKKAKYFRLTNSNGTVAKIFDDGIAGVKLTNNTFNLKISTCNVDCDGDGSFDDLELGFWFNDKLYNNAYMYVTDTADRYAPYVGVYCATERGNVALGDIVQTVATPVDYCADKFAYFVDGDTVTVDGVDCGESKTLSKPGVYDVTYTDAASIYKKAVTVYKTNDATEDGKVDIRDLVALKKYAEGSRALNAPGQKAIGVGDSFDSDSTHASMVAYLLKDDNVIGAKEFSEDIIGQTGSGTYINAVDYTKEGTSVISLSDTKVDTIITLKDTEESNNVDKFNGLNLDYVLDFATDRDIKILQITDTQLVDSTQNTFNLTEEKIEAYKPTDENRAKLLYNELDQLIAETNPDLILITGDIVWGTYDDAGTVFENIAAHMDSYKIPWAPIFGNHDQETKKGTAWICDLFVNAKYCMFTRRNEIGGNGNYSIGIAKNGTLERTIFMMDSSGIYGASSEEIANGTTNYVYMLHDEQIAWYRTVADSAGVPSFVCFHSPMADILTALVEKGHQSAIDNDYKKYYYDLGMDNTQEDFGFKYEALTGSMHGKDYIYPYLKAAGTDGVFMGHDHLEALSIKWQDIRWTWGLKTGHYSYYGKTGGTMITLDGSDFVVEYKVITDTTTASVTCE